MKRSNSLSLRELSASSLVQASMSDIFSSMTLTRASSPLIKAPLITSGCLKTKLTLSKQKYKYVTTGSMRTKIESPNGSTRNTMKCVIKTLLPNRTNLIHISIQSIMSLQSISLNSKINVRSHQSDTHKHIIDNVSSKHRLQL